MTQPRIYPLGDAALVCEVPPPATLDCQRRVWAVAEVARAWPDVIDVVPGMNNLTIVFDALAATAESLTPALRDAWETADVEHAEGREVEIPVEYGGTAGPDLPAVAAHTGLSADEVVARHAGANTSCSSSASSRASRISAASMRHCTRRAARRRAWKCRPARSASAVRRRASIRPRRPAAGN